MRVIMYSLFSLVVGCGPILLLPATAAGQQPTGAYEHTHSRLDLNFPGGTVQQFVEAVRKARPKVAANVVVMPSARALEVPPVNLVAVTVDAAIRVLEGPYRLANGAWAHVSVEGYNIGDSSDLVLKVMAQVDEGSTRSSVWNIEPALAAGQSAEELLGAVEAVLTLFSQKAEISYHPPTRLLIARGSDEQLNLVEETIEQLIASAAHRRDKIAAIRGESEDLEEELNHIQGQITISNQTLELAHMRLAHATEAGERGDVPRDHVAEMRLEVTRAETRLNVERARQERLKRRVGRLHEALKRLEQPRE